MMKYLSRRDCGRNLMIRSLYALLGTAVVTAAFIAGSLSVTDIPAYAAGNGKGMQFGHEMLVPVMTKEDGQENAKEKVTTAQTVYYGTNGTKGPQAWYVIGYNGAGAVCVDNKMALLAPDNITTSAFAENEKDPASASYKNSTIKPVVDAYYDSLFTDAERKEIVKRNLYHEEYSDSVLCDGIYDENVEDGLPAASEYMWLLSAKEADLLGATYLNAKNYEDAWWLRSTGKYIPEYDGHHGGYVAGSCVWYDKVNSADMSVGWKYGVRPAFIMNPSILFVAAATGGKDPGTGGIGTLNRVGDYSGSEWKLTLRDPDRKFSAQRTDSEKVMAGDDISISYSGATVGQNQYVSAIIARPGEILYYGRIADKSSGDTAGTAKLTIPGDIAVGDYDILLFSEECNGDKKTDHASVYQVINVTVEKKTPTASDFEVEFPSDTTYDGNPKTVTAKPAVEGIGMGDITVKYYDSKDKELAGPPTERGTYRIKLDVTEGTNCYAAKGITKDAWTFTIHYPQYSVTVNTDGNGYAAAIPASAVPGETVRLIAIANNGFEFKKWTSADGVKFTDPENASTTFPMLAKNVTVTAHYEAEKTSLENAKVVLKKNRFVYNKKTQIPSVRTIGALTLREDKDYTVSVKDSKGQSVKSPVSAGKYTLVIKGTGKYKGTTKADYEIVKAANKLKVTAAKEKYTVRRSKLKKDKQSISASDIYKFTNKNKTKGTLKFTLSSVKKNGKKVGSGFSVKKSSGKLTIKKNMAKGSYKIKVKVSAGNTNYETVTKTVSFTVKVK